MAASESHDDFEPSTVPRDERLFRSLLEAAPDGMVIVDQLGKIVLVNAQTERLFGYDRAELIGKGVETLVPARFAAGHEMFRSGYTRGPRTRPMGLAGKLFARRKDGTEFPVEISLAPLETEQGLLISAAVRDITERARIQAEANRAKDEFFASVSHELRTPLTSMIGYAELMEDLDDLPTEARGFLEVISRSAHRELRLVNDLLTLVKLESEGLSMQSEDLDVADLAAQAVAGAAPVAADEGLALDLVLSDTDVRVHGDAIRLAQVLDNLLSNAVKFTPGGGRVTVGVHRDGSRAVVEVTDDGPGVAVEDQGRLFERLFRTRDAVERGIPGAGLGLSIARGIVEAHEGLLEVSSAEGRGSTFRVVLPLVSAAPDAIGPGPVGAQNNRSVGSSIPRSAS